MLRSGCVAVLLLCSGLGFMAETEARTKERFLVPFMWHGPSNQINAVKETLALAALVQRTVAVPDLQQQRFSDGNFDPMPFDVLYDFAHLKASADVVLLADLKSELPDWDRTLDAVLLMGKAQEQGIVTRLAKDIGLQPPPKQFWLHSPVSCLGGCHPEQVAELRALLEPYDVVGVQTFHGLFVASQLLAGPLGWECGNNACCQSFEKATLALRKAPQAMDAAQGFIQRRMGEGQPFVAAHVRPYPDGCIAIWTMLGEGNTVAQKTIDKECFNEYLYDRFAPSIKSLMVAYNTKKAFIMTHPKVRSIVQSKLREHGVEPIFMDFEEALPLEKRVASVSASVLAVLEEAVCAHATGFIGTKESSMSGAIVQERLSSGVSLADTYTFYPMEGRDTKPVKLTDFYKLREVDARAIWQNVWTLSVVRDAMVGPQAGRRDLQRDTAGMQEHS